MQKIKFIKDLKMKKQRILCGFLATTAILSATTFTACNLNNKRKDVFCVQTESGRYQNALLYKLEDYTVYYQKDGTKTKLNALTILLPPYYACKDTRERITKENETSHEENITLSQKNFTNAHITDLRINDYGFSLKYNSYLYADATYKLIEEKPLLIEENDETFIVTYYDLLFTNEEQTLYEWVSYKDEFIKDNLTKIVYRAK